MTTLLLKDKLDVTLVPAPVKAAMKDNGAVSSDLWKLPRSSLFLIPDFNVRVKDDKYRAGIRELADDMKANGFKQHKPIAGYAAIVDGINVLYVTDGHRRLEAFDLAVSEGAELDDKLPYVLMAKGSNLEDATYELLTTATGVGLTRYEKSVIIKRLSRYGHEPKEIAERIPSLTIADIDEYLLFASTPRALQELVASGKASFEHALTVFKQHGAEAQALLKDAAAKAQADAAKTPGSKKRSTRIMPKHMPGYALKNALTKHAAELFGALQKVSDDPAFQSLAPEAREEVAKMVAFIKNAADTDSPATAAASATNVVAMQQRAA